MLLSGSQLELLGVRTVDSVITLDHNNMTCLRF